jgi:3-oxoacyl-[acyl-carrier-protein] synthase II
VSVLVASSVARTCFGDDAATWAAVLRGDCGVGGLRYFPAARLNVRCGYHVPEPGPERPLRATGWLAGCVAEAVRRAGLDPRRRRVVALVGTGLRELRAVERWAVDADPLRAEQLHFADAVRRAAPGVEVAVTLSNACSAAGHALALGQDLLELGEADAVVVAGADAMTESMLAIIGRFAEEPTDRVRPFDEGRPGVLLGEGAAAVVLVPEGTTGARSGCPPVARLLATGLSCDARHETAPDAAGIRRAVWDALDRAGRRAQEVDVVFAHGTGTELNDPTEAAVLAEVFAAAEPGPLVTAVKGAVGHTSGASPLTSLALAVHSLREQVVPPVVGLRRPLEQAAGLRFVLGEALPAPVRLVQVDAFGFGGVNAVSLFEAA